MHDWCFLFTSNVSLKRAGGGSRSEAHSLGQTPKDLGTMIYLLGTQSNSMNARRLGNASR